MYIPKVYPDLPLFSISPNLISNPSTTICDVHIFLGMGPSMGLWFTSQEPNPWRILSLSSQKLSAVHSFSATSASSWTHPHCMLESWLTWTCEGTHVCYDPVNTTVVSCLERFVCSCPPWHLLLQCFYPIFCGDPWALGQGCDTGVLVMTEHTPQSPSLFFNHLGVSKCLQWDLRAALN